MFGRFLKEAVAVATDVAELKANEPPKKPVASPSGWLLKERGSFANDRTSEYRQLVEGLSKKTVPAEWKKDYEFLFVPGLMTEHYGKAYMATNLERMQKLGLTARKVEIDTDSSVAVNADVVKQAILSSKKKQCVIFGHSKGGIDASAALVLYPELQSKVRALITVQSPYGGTSVADIIAQNGLLLQSAKVVVENLFRGNVHAILDLSYEKRQEFVRKHPLDCKKVPTLCFGSTCNGGSMGVVIEYLRSTYNVESDGLVPKLDAIIPGCDWVEVHGVDHGSSVGLMPTISQGLQSLSKQEKQAYYDSPADLTQALVTLALSKR